ncbi:MMPL family transporter [Cellulomonas soli]|uniref:MMPL family transporter n=1 Tax=Cellulomonas soli TaxID=931535 RepID=UPI003F864B53
MPVLSPPRRPGPTRDAACGPGAGHRLPAARRLARWSATHRWTAVLLWLLLVVVAVGAGGAVGMRTLTGAESGAGESGRADLLLEDAGFPADATEHVLIQAPVGHTLAPAEAEAVAAELRDGFGRLDEVGAVGDVVLAEDGRSAMLPVTIDLGDATGTAASDLAGERVPALLAVTAQVADDHPDLTVAQAGDASVNVGMNDRVAGDFRRAELLSLPITFGILLLTFGALFAAGVPVLLALSAVGTAIGLASLVSQVMPATQTLSSVVLLVGMAVGVDYSLFYVRRMREELAHGGTRSHAIDVAAATSGRAVVTSGIAVVVSMCGLLLSGQAVFTSMAIGTVLVVAVAVLGSLTVLPAVLSLLGDRIDRPRIPFLHRKATGDSRFWATTMRVVLARPAISLAVAVGALLALAAPALGIRLGESSIDSMPAAVPAVAAYQGLTEAFPQTGSSHTVVVSTGDRAPLDQDAVRVAVDHLLLTAQASGRFADLSATTTVFAPDGATATVDLPIPDASGDTRAEGSLTLLRDELAPQLRSDLRETAPDADVLVTGGTAWAVDFRDTLREHLPWVVTFVLLATFVVLVLAFRSVVVAGTAVVLTLLSVGAAYGLLVLVFQHGFATGLLGVQHSGFVVDWLPLFLFVILFGLSMDYHVFVVSRIREAAQEGLPTRAAVARGVTRSAGVVTSAAAVMVGVFAIFGSLSLVEFEQLGVGLAAAVILDATLVRAVLLPAAMAVLGRYNWWLPGWLDRVLPAAHGEQVPAAV